MAHSFEDAGRLGQELLDSGMDSMASVSEDARLIAMETSDYARKVVEAGSEAFSKLLSAKSIDRAVDIQTAYLRQSYEGFVAEAMKLGGLYADMAKDAYRPFEAIVARTR
ncbi:MAG: phasin family protein [Rhizobiaceae bacterium]|nr:phasin family protein [Rhizobiaceae bacterium]